MHHPTLFVKDHEHGEAKASAVIQPRHQSRGLVLARCSGRVWLAMTIIAGRHSSFRTWGDGGRASRVVVYVDILEVVADDLADGSVIRYEVGKAQAPRTPVSAYLTDYELTFRLCLCYSLVYLFEGINLLVIHLLQSCLGIGTKGKEESKEQGAGA